MKTTNDALEFIKQKHNGEIPYLFGKNEYGRWMAEFANHVLAEQKLDIANVVGRSEQLFCCDCKYDKTETYHDKMWCRDCRQKDRFTAN